MICTADRIKHILYISRELNIYYTSEITKIWAETRSLLNIWSWIERVCLNDKNSEFASKTNNDWSCHQARHSKWVCYNDKSIVDLLIESVIEQKTSSIECNRHEWNKFYYMRVVDTNETDSAMRCRHESKDNDWSHWLSSSLDSESAWKTFEVSLLQWHQNLIQQRISYSYLLWFISVHDIDDNSKDNMYCRQSSIYYMSRKNRTYTICLKTQRYELKLVHHWIFEAE